MTSSMPIGPILIWYFSIILSGGNKIQYLPLLLILLPFFIVLSIIEKVNDQVKIVSEQSQDLKLGRYVVLLLQLLFYCFLAT